MTAEQRAELIALAERVEKAAGADGELTALIRCAVFAGPNAYVRQSPINGAWCIYEPGYNGKERSWEPRGLTLEQRTGDFLNSLDAAMSLVPVGWRFGLEEGAITDTDCTMTCAWAWPFGEGHKGWQIDNPKAVLGHAATPALALTAAAIRALAAQDTQP